ncbi:unnamed protein product [Heligmosomoides polygyrus]|uniref:Uncharacterized protein n=1 Tax=Heligmosomoides polygyrus TaxID=6339 RepID=A0A183G9T0_HELPZ|nr:unnamed protein product [Heligmosomoides polygyrus]
MYQVAKKATKKAVAVANAVHYDELNEKFESRDGERHLYRLAKARHRQTEDIDKFLDVSDDVSDTSATSAFCGSLVRPSTNEPQKGCGNMA